MLEKLKTKGGCGPRGGGGKKTFKQAQKTEHKTYYKCARKCRRMKLGTNRQVECYKKCKKLYYNQKEMLKREKS